MRPQQGGGRFPGGVGTRGRGPAADGPDDSLPVLRYPVPAVRAVVRDGNGRVLLLRVGDKWELPGGEFVGGVDWKTMVRDCLVKSCGAAPKSVKLIGLYSKLENNPDGRNRLVCGFVVDGLDREPTSLQAEWRLEEDLPQGLGSAHKQVVMDARAFKGEPVVR